MQFSTAQLKAINDGASHACTVGRGLVELGDLQQEAWLWLYSNREKVEGWLADDGRLDRLRNCAFQAGLILIRDTMRDQCGSLPQDFAVYNTASVAALLPTVFLDGAFSTGPEVNDEVRHIRIPSEGGVGLAIAADIKAAFAKLTQPQKQLLWRLHGKPEPDWHKDVADDLGTSEATIRRREQRALEAIVDALGGPRQSIKRRKPTDALRSVS